jgi:bacteriorhodopsin
MSASVLESITRSSFLLVFIAFAACALFLALERDRVPDRFRTTIRVSVVYLAIASINYFYMKDVYAAGLAAGAHRFPTEYRYVDWVLTTPLMLLKFPLLLGIGRKGFSFMTRLVVLDLVMIITGWIGDMSTSPGAHYGFFLIGCLAWLFILVSLFGALGSLPERIGEATRGGVRAMGMFVLVGWAVYPLGYFSPILGVPDDVRELLYNVADLVNKVGLCLVVYVTAKRSAAEEVVTSEEGEASYGSLAPEAAE